MAMPPESARGHSPERLYSGAVVSLPGGHGVGFPGAEARGADRAVARANGAAMAECCGKVCDQRLADPPCHQGGTGHARGVLCGDVCTAGVAHHLSQATSPSPAPHTAASPPDGAQLGPTWAARWPSSH
jgi:hypothetical protein